MNNRKIILYILLLVTFSVIGGVSAYFANYKRSFSSVTIDTKINNNIDIYYADTSADNNISYDKKQKPVVSIDSPSKLRLKKAHYVLVINDSKGDYKKNIMPMFPDTNEFAITIDPDLSDIKLRSIALKERPDIIKAINNQVHDYSNSVFSIKYVSVFKKGNWAGATLVPRDKSTQDTYRLILNKKNQQWKLATNPPEITIGSPKYPNIPKGVVSGVDTLGF